MEIARGGKLREGVARAPEGFGRLARAELATVPDDRRPCAASGRVGRDPRHGLLANGRQRTPRVDFRSDRVAVMDEKQMQRR